MIKTSYSIAFLAFIASAQSDTPNAEARFGINTASVLTADAATCFETALYEAVAVREKTKSSVEYVACSSL